jgi:hypothetical protein
LVLTDTTDSDDTIRFELTCDGCGVTFTADTSVRADAADLWMAAFWQGWRLARGSSRQFGHQCGACVTPPATIE